MDIEFDFKGDPLGGVITNCEYFLLLFHFNEHAKKLYKPEDLQVMTAIE